jgi:uncharacterized membrane protein
MIATVVGLVAVLAAIAGTARRARSGNEAAARGPVRVRVFLAGVVLANAVPHLVHGLAGAQFPAPFARQLGPGVPNHVLNVVWAVFNLAAGVNLARVYWCRPSPRAFVALIVAGAAAMAAFLVIVFGT